jgi:hypothetical protein
MVTYGLCATETNATVRTTVNVFPLSRSLNIYLPYFLALGLAVPFIAMVIITRMRNEVSATDRRFIQLLSTTTGSAALSRAAAGSYLGGDENVSEGLKDLRVWFGELIEVGGATDGMSRRGRF